MVATDLDLHRAIVRAAANPLLVTLYENLLDAIGENIRFNFVTDTHGHDAHDVLVEAIVAGDDGRPPTRPPGTCPHCWASEHGW